MHFTKFLSYLAVSILWGCTNPFIKSAQSTESLTIYSMFKKILTDYKTLIPLLLNQSGSLLFYYLLAKEPISFAVPVVNSLTLFFTCITAYALGETLQSAKLFILGSILIIAGIYLCLS
jgi:drug/metabolite transporter (DMT)-like permease